MRLTDMKTTIAALALIALVACGSPAETQPGARGSGGGSDGSPGSMTPFDPESPVSCPPDCGDGGGGDIEPGKPKIVEPRPGMDDIHPVGWDKAKVRGPRSVLITYWSGVEPCNVLDHVDVVYKEKTIEVTLFEGHDPSDEDTACIEIALLKGVELELDEAIDGRKIVDGAD